MIEVEVLYADLSRQCVPIDKVDTLSTGGVLAVVVRNTEKAGKKQNIATALGFDNYALCERTMNGGLWIAIFGWDDDDFIWRRTSEHLSPEARFPVDPPLGCMHITFRGQYISAEDWQEALRVYNKEIL